MDSILLILVSVLIVLTTVAALVLFRLAHRRGGGDETARIAVLEERLSAGETERRRLEEELSGRREEVGNLKEVLELRNRELSTLERELAIARNTLSSEQQQHAERLKTLKGDQEEMVNRFKVLADGILKENTRQFKEQNAAGLGELLNPLKERLGEFQKTIQENYETEGKERHSLRSEVQKLAEMNARLSEEASNLTNALKGENKTQGNWGEMILERILEVSGLRKR